MVVVQFIHVAEEREIDTEPYPYVQIRHGEMVSGFEHVINIATMIDDVWVYKGKTYTDAVICGVSKP